MIEMNKDLSGARARSLQVDASISTEMVRGRILMVRGVQVLLDRDLAELYGVSTGALNQAVKRNSNRFPERFMFQLSEEEFKNWKSQIVISNLSEATVRMGLRKRPFVFTEHGVAMLASVLRSETAIRVCKCLFKTSNDANGGSEMNQDKKYQRTMTTVSRRNCGDEKRPWRKYGIILPRNTEQR